MNEDIDLEGRSFGGLLNKTIQNSARAAHGQLPDTHGFILIIVPLSDKNTGKGKADYVSNVCREDAVRAIKEILFRWGIEEEWMKQAK